MLISIAILSVFSLHCPLFLFCLSCYLHLSLFSLSRTLIWKEGALLPTQYVLFLPAALSCWTPPQDPALLDKTQGIHAFLFCFISIYRLRRRSTLSRPEGEKGKLIPIQRVVKVWWMSALKQHDSGGGGYWWLTLNLNCFVLFLQERPRHVGPRSVTILMWVLQKLLFLLIISNLFLKS